MGMSAQQMAEFDGTHLDRPDLRVLYMMFGNLADQLDQGLCESPEKDEAMRLLALAKDHAIQARMNMTPFGELEELLVT